MDTCVPICYTPSRKLILDDDQAFSESILLKMNDKNSIIFNSSQDALKYLLNEYQPTFIKADLIKLDHGDDKTGIQQVINIQFEKLEQMIIKSQFQDISVVLVDYHMPEMSGLDFLKEIKHLPIKKILITGEKDNQVAIKAFNQGLVDAYIKKDEINFKNFQDIISNLEWEYFVELSGFVLDMPNFSYLKNKKFISFFKKFIDKNHVSAFCCTDMHGSFMIQRKDGVKSHLVLRNKIQLQELSALAKEDGASADVVSLLEKGEVIPFFGSKEYWQIPANNWDQYLYPAQEIIDVPGFLWAGIG